MTAAETKKALRASALATREAAARAAPGAARALAGYASALPAAKVVAAYVPIRSEVDPMPLVGALLGRGGRLALPAVVDGRLVFRAHRPGVPLRPGPFGIAEPTGAALVPDLVLVPLLAFRRDGTRLGYGAGHYDRWLAAHPSARAVGLAYATQEMPALPAEPHDAPLHAVLTERELIAVGEGACV